MRSFFSHSFSIFITLTLSINLAFATTVPHKIVIKGKIPEGVEISRTTIKLKPGYKFEKVSKHKVNVVARIRGGGTGITGSFDCTCNGNDGGCDVVTTPTSVSCATSTCKSSCYMITTIPGGPTKVIQ